VDEKEQLEIKRAGKGEGKGNQKHDFHIFLHVPCHHGV
jgi:hypothetical protein